MSQFTIDKTGALTGGATNFQEVLRALTQSQMRKVLAGNAAITDSSGATASAVREIKFAPLFTANTAASGSNLAGKVSLETALATIQNGLKTLATKIDAVAVLAGTRRLTYSGGGTDGAGTIAALTLTCTGAATGITMANSNPIVNSVNNAVYNLATQVKEIVAAVEGTELQIPPKATPLYIPPGSGGTSVLPATLPLTILTTVPALTVTGGTAADPAITKAQWDAAMLLWGNDIATLAAALNEVNALVSPLVRAVY